LLIHNRYCDPYTDAAIAITLCFGISVRIEVARLVLRDSVNATVVFEDLAVEVEKSSESLHRMLSARGNPTMDNLKEK